MLRTVFFETKVIYAQGPVASGWPALLVSQLLHKKLVIKVVGDYCWEQAQLFHATQKKIDDWQKSPEFKAPQKSINLKLRIINYIEKTSILSGLANISTCGQHEKNNGVFWL